ncbi:MAG: alpha/beta hydrolase [Methylocystaceae bacterium]
MANYYYVWNEAQPFFLTGSSTAILLLHGFTASPSEVKALGLLLQHKGYTVSAPLLPGHGSHPRHLNATSTEEWQQAVSNELEYLNASYQQVFMVGLSLGGLLALWTMEQRLAISGVVAINPALELKSRLTRLAYPLSKTLGYMPKGHKKITESLEKQGRFAYDVIPVKSFLQLDQLRKQIWQDVKCLDGNLLIIQSRNDETVNSAAVADFFGQIPAEGKQYLELLNSGHVATMGPEKEMIAEAIHAAITSWTNK